MLKTTPPTTSAALLLLLNVLFCVLHKQGVRGALIPPAGSKAAWPVLHSQTNTTIPYDQCGASIGCFALSDDGDEGDSDATCITAKNCAALATYRLGSGTTDDDGHIDFVLYRDDAGQNSYVAVGLSNNGSMADSVIVACLHGDGADIVQTLFATDEIPPDAFDGMKLVNSTLTVVDGTIVCAFALATTPAIRSPDKAYAYDLTRPIHLLLAVGDVKSGPAAIKKHDLRVASPAPIDLLRNSATTTTISPTTTTNTSPSGGAVPYEKCGKTSGCFGMPDKCLAASNCRAVVVYAAKQTKASSGLSENNNNNKNDSSSTIVFDLYLTSASDEHYVALGFNHAPQQMAKSAIVECVSHSSKVSTITAYAPDTVPPQPIDMGKVFQQTSATLVDGVLQCSFEITGVINTPEKFDTGTPLYLLLATGDVGGDGAIKKHARNDKLASAQPVDLTKFSTSGGATGTPALIKLHAAFMLFAWLFCATIGIVSSQFYKAMWPTWKPMGKLMWFHVHRTLMMAAALFSVAAIVVIFVHIRGWSTSASNIHPFIGILCFGLAFLQPSLAYFRPHPGEPHRVYFNYLHGTIGHVAHALSLVAIVLATFLDSIDMPAGARLTMWVFIGYIAVHYVLQIIVMLSSSQTQMLQADTRPYVAIKNFLFLLHLLAATAFTTTMIVYVILA